MTKTCLTELLQAIRRVLNWGKNRTPIGFRFRPGLMRLEDRLAPADFWWRSRAGSTAFEEANNWITGPQEANAIPAVFRPGTNDTVHLNSNGAQADCITGSRHIGALDIQGFRGSFQINPGATVIVTGVDANQVGLSSRLVGATIVNSIFVNNVPGVLAFSQDLISVTSAVFRGITVTTARASSMQFSGSNLEFLQNSRFINGGEFTWSGNGSIANANAASSFLNSGTFIAAGDWKFSGSLSNRGTFFKNGTGTTSILGSFLNQTGNPAGGTLQINGGILSVTISEINELLSELVLNGGKLKTTVILDGGRLSGTGVISGTLRCQAAGTLRDTIHPGMLPNSPGGLTINGTLIMGARTILQIDSDANGNHGQIVLDHNTGGGATVSIDGTLIVNRNAGWTPPAGATFPFIGVATFNGLQAFPAISLLCYLPLDCHFLPDNAWGNTPPPEQKKIVRDERTTKRDSIYCGLLDPGQGLLGRQAFLDSGFRAELLGGGLEAVSFV